MRKTIAFLRYVIDPRKAKALVLYILIVVLATLTGCRAQHKIDQANFEEEKAALVAAHAAELENVTAQLQAESQAKAAPQMAEAEEIAKVLYGTARYNTEDDQRLVVWCIINRSEATGYPDTITGVCQQPSQWMGYSEDNPVLENLLSIASEELARYYAGSPRPVGPEYIFLSWTENEIVLRDKFEETARTHYWRA